MQNANKGKVVVNLEQSHGIKFNRSKRVDMFCKCIYVAYYHWQALDFIGFFVFIAKTVVFRRSIRVGMFGSYFLVTICLILIWPSSYE